MKMKAEYGYNDEILNQFKLMIYNWNINNAIKYYNNDSFCHDYCIDYNFKYGCKKQDNQCPFKHSQTFNLYDLVFGHSKQQHYKRAKLLCLYLMNKKIYNDNNSKLFMYYGELLYRTGTKVQDYLKSEQYFLKSLRIDNNNGYAHNNFDKAEYHHKKAVETDPNHAIGNYNFAWFLKNIQQKHNTSLMCINKACELEPNASDCHELKGLILYLSNKFEESIDETIHALKLNENDGHMDDEDIDDAKQLIELAIKKYMIKKLNVKYYFNFSEFEGYKLIKWLYDNQLLSIKCEIFLCSISMNVLLDCNDKDCEELVEEMKLSTSMKVKFRNARQKLLESQSLPPHVEKSDMMNVDISGGVSDTFEIGLNAFIQGMDNKDLGSAMVASKLTRFVTNLHYQCKSQESKLLKSCGQSIDSSMMAMNTSINIDSFGSNYNDNTSINVPSIPLMTNSSSMVTVDSNDIPDSNLVYCGNNANIYTTIPHVIRSVNRGHGININGNIGNVIVNDNVAPSINTSYVQTSKDGVLMGAQTTTSQSTNWSSN